MDLRWRKFCQRFLYWKKVKKSQRPWNNWKRWVPLVERPNFVPPFPYFAYMQYLEPVGEYLRNKLLGYFPKGKYPYVTCFLWLKQLDSRIVPRICPFSEAWQCINFSMKHFYRSTLRFRVKFQVCQVCLVFGGSNFRLDWRIQVKYCLQQFHFDFGTLWAQINFLTNASGPSIFYWHTFNFSWLGSPISPRGGDRRVWRPMVWVISLSQRLSF